jgi:serine protease Do
VRDGSPADLAGIKRGDVIQEVSKHRVTSISDVQAAIAKSNDKDSLLLLVRRGGTSLFAALEAK